MPEPLLSARLLAVAAAYAFVGWIFFTALLIALGDALLPVITRPLAPVVVLALVALTSVAVAGLSLDFFRRSGRADAVAGLTLGVCFASIGLTLDGLMLLLTDFRYPNVEAAKTATLAVLLLLGYAVAAAVPVLVVALRVRPGRPR